MTACGKTKPMSHTKMSHTNNCRKLCVGNKRGKGAPTRIFGADHQLLKAVLADMITDEGVYLKPFIYPVALFIYST